MRYLKRFSETLDESSSNESSTNEDELSIDLVKDILFSVYEDEFDSHKFEFFNYVDVVGRSVSIPSNEIRNFYPKKINFIPNQNVIYFNVDKDKWNTEGSIRIELIQVLFNDFSKGVLFWTIDKYDLDKYQLFTELISEWGWRVLEPNKDKPSDATSIYRPNREGNGLALDSLRKCSYSIIPN